MVIAYGVVVSDWGKLQRNVVPRIGDAPLIALSGQTSIAEAYNSILDAYISQGRMLDALVLQHDDLEVIDPLMEEKLQRAMTEDAGVGLVGVIGTRKVGSLAWWNGGIVGHQQTDSMMIKDDPLESCVACTDGSFMALSSWAVENVRFDTRYPGFHGYDVDMGMQLTRQGRKVKVADIDTHHHTTLGFKSPEIQASWEHAAALFADKWAL